LSNSASLQSTLASKVSRFLLDNAEALKEGRDGSLELNELNLALQKEAEESLVVGYILGLLNGQVTARTQELISARPVLFWNELVSFVNAMREIGRGDAHRLKQGAKLAAKLLEDLSHREELSLLSKNQVSVLKVGLNDSYDKHSTVGLINLSDRVRSVQPESPSTLALSVIMESANEGGEARVYKNYLTAMDALLYRTKAEALFSKYSIDQLLKSIQDLESYLEALQTPASNHLPAKVELFDGKNLLNNLVSELCEKFNLMENADLTDELIQKLRSIVSARGARNGSPELRILQRLQSVFPEEARNPIWWMKLNLAELLDVINATPSLTEDVTSAQSDGDWFARTVANHLDDGRSIQDLLICIAAHHLFQKPTSEEIIKLWKLISPSSELLQEISASLIELPLTEASRLAAVELEKIRILHQTDVDELNEKLAQAKEDANKLKSALESRGHSVSEARGDMELGVAKKYGEALARLIRRLERDSSKSSLKEILEREAAGLKRLDIQLVPAGVESNFDPSIHDSAGIQIALGSKVQTLESGALLTIGDKTITLMKAVVKPSS